MLINSFLIKQGYFFIKKCLVWLSYVNNIYVFATKPLFCIIIVQINRLGK